MLSVIAFCIAGYFLSIHVRGVYAISGSFVESMKSPLECSLLFPEGVAN